MSEHRGAVLASPVGPILASVDLEGRVTQIRFVGQLGPVVALRAWGVHRDPEAVREVESQLRSYFAGQSKAFDLPLAPKGTPFEAQVWEALRAIPYGQTRTYGDIARLFGGIGHARAVGRANALNPISIVVPCHRVIGASGKLTGYSGGTDVKARLLALEQGSIATLFDFA